MKRYFITQKLRDELRKSKYSMGKLSKILGFEIKNIYYKNKTVREEHLKKINSFFNTNFQLSEEYPDYLKNLGIRVASPKPCQVKESEDLAEFIGIMLGDGNIWENQLSLVG